MIGGARTMTAAVGHGKKAARNIDAWLRGGVYEKPPQHPPVPYELLNLTVFLDAERREHAELPVAKRTGFDEIVVRPLGEGGALRGDAVPLLRQLLRVRQLLRRLSRSRRSSSWGRAGSTGSSSTSAPAAPRASNSARAMRSRWRRSRGPRASPRRRSRESARSLHRPRVTSTSAPAARASVTKGVSACR